MPVHMRIHQESPIASTHTFIENRCYYRGGNDLYGATSTRERWLHVNDTSTSKSCLLCDQHVAGKEGYRRFAVGSSDKTPPF
jgi:hypothetical protein